MDTLTTKPYPLTTKKLSPRTPIFGLPLSFVEGVGGEKLMKEIINFRKGALLTLLVAAATVANCSKSKDEPEVPTKIETPEHLSDWTPQPKVDVAQPYMAFAVGSASATSVTLTNVKAAEGSAEVWVDTNNNGIFDEGDVKVTDFSKPVTFKVTDKVFTVYGKVTELNASGNALTAADLRSNEALSKLNIADNQLSEAALVSLAASLPTATDPNAAVVLRNADDPNEKNAVTDAVLGAAKERGWQTLKTERGSEVPDLPTDTEAPTPATISERIAVTDQTATLSWETAKDNQTSFEGLRYQVFWKAQDSTEEKNSGTPKAAFFSYKIEGLTPSTTYAVWVEVFDKAGNKAPYPEKTFTTAKKEEPKPDALNTSDYIVFTTDKAVGEEISIFIQAAKEDQAGVWLDLNNNDKWDEGIDQKPKFGYSRYILKAQTFKIYGKVSSLNCRSNLLTAIDISHNPALKELFACNNYLPSIAHLEQLKELGIDTHTLLASSLPKGLTFFSIKETPLAPLTTIDISPFTELIVLDIYNCKSIKSLDLSHNEKLSRLHTDYTGLTALDLSHQPNLTDLYASHTPLTKINIAGNKALKYVDIQLTDKGEGLQGEALMDFLRQLPTYEEGKEGKIFLSPAQATDAVKEYLSKIKFWKVE